MAKRRWSARALGVSVALVLAAGAAALLAGETVLAPGETTGSAVTTTAVLTPAAAAASSLLPGGAFGTPRPLAGVPGLGITEPVFNGLELSCTAVGDCGAIGGYTAAVKGSAADEEAFVVTETHGHWGKPAAVPGLARLNTMGQVSDLRITCPAAGSCTAGGQYVSKVSATSGLGRAFVVTESKGIWGHVQTFSTAGLSAGASGASGLDALSCPSAGNCVAAGDYGSAQGSLPFIVVQRHGTWGPPRLIPGMTALVGKAQAIIAVPRAIACDGSGDCTVVGGYPDSAGRDDAFIATERHGAWTPAAPLPGLAALQSTSSTRYTDVDGLACDSSGRDCTAAGVFTSPRGRTLPFVLAKTGGTWGTVRPLPGTSALNLSNGNGGAVILSCPTQASCTIAADAWTASSPSAFGNSQVYLDSEVKGVWGTPWHLRGVPAGDGAGGEVTALSCGAAGSCTIGGYYAAGGDPSVAFLASETSGVWSGPLKIKLPGATDNTQIGALSCVAAGYCTATAFQEFPAPGAVKPTVYLISEGAASPVRAHAPGKH